VTANRGAGGSSPPLACGPGRDYQTGEDPDAEKQALEARHCDPSIREPFIVALASELTEPPRTEGRAVTGIAVESATSMSGAATTRSDCPQANGRFATQWCRRAM
jgi:hypothetical protein